MRILVAFPADANSYPLRLKDILAHFVFLCFFACLDVLPSQYRAAYRTRYVADCMLARHEIAWHSFVLVCIRQCACMLVDMAWCALDEVCATMTAGETFTDDLTRETEVGAAFCTVEA